MANSKSAEKRVRVAAKRTLRNKHVKSTTRTAIKKAHIAFAAGSQDSQTAFQTAVSAIDKAATKGVMHKNTASRRKSRLARRLNAVGA